MAPVIRIDDEVMDELKKRAVDFGLVFEPPNATIRKVLGLDSKAALQSTAIASTAPASQQSAVGKEYIVHGEIYKQRRTQVDSTWEIGHFKRADRGLLSYDQYPFVKDVGISIRLVIEAKEYPASFHHYPVEKGGGGYIGRRARDTSSIKEILATHSLDKYKMPVTLCFRGDKVHLEPANLAESDK